MIERYMNTSANLLRDMRLRIEGIVALMEGDAVLLRNLAVSHDLLTAANAFDTIESALYSLQKDIRALHEAHINESVRQAKEREMLYIVKVYEDDQIHEYGLLEHAKLHMQTERCHSELYVCLEGKDVFIEGVN